MDESLEEFCQAKSEFAVIAEQKASALAMEKKIEIARPQILWAVNPQENEVENLEPIASALNNFSMALNCAISPVAVIGSNETHWPLKINAHETGTVLSGAESGLDKMLQETGIRELEEPTFLLNKTAANLDLAVQSVLDLAWRERPFMIAVNTHGLKGWQHLRLGSFAERLIAQSPIPVLTVNPKTLSKKAIRNILMPTDFSASSFEFFKKALVWAKRFSADFVLVNRFASPITGMAYIGAAEVPVDGQFLADLVDQAEKDRKRSGTAWAEMAAKAGVPCAVVYESDGKNLSSIILETIKTERADLVVMQANHEIIGQGIGGTARRVLTEASCPVVLSLVEPLET